MKDRPKTKSQRKAARLAEAGHAADVVSRAAAVTNPAIAGSADRLGTPGVADGQALRGTTQGRDFL